MATAEDMGFKVEKLSGENYHSWKFQMKMYLIGKDLWEIVSGTETLSAEATAAEQSKFRKRENMALASVCLSIATNLQIYVRSAVTAKEAWENLEKHFEEKSLSRKIFYRRKLYSARMQKGTSMINHINYVKTLSEHLEAVGDAVAEKDLVIILISSLPEDYNYLITALETIAEEKLTWDYVRDRLIHEAEKIKLTAGTEKTNACQDALLVTDKKSEKKPADTKNFKCHYCKRKAHCARDCYKKKADAKKSQQQEHSRNNPRKESANGNFVTNCDENKEESEVTAPEIALVSDGEPGDNNWWIDSGASQHMTPVKKSLINFEKFKTPLEVKLADNSVLFSYGKGDVHLSVYNGTEKVNIALKDVLYVPKIQNKLMSLPSMTLKGATVEFKGQSCTVIIDDKAYQIGHKHGKLYKLNSAPKDATCCFGNSDEKVKQEPLPMRDSQMNSILLWHLRYGHLGYDNIKLLNNKSMVEGLNFSVKEEFNRNCEGCAMGKQNR